MPHELLTLDLGDGCRIDVETRHGLPPQNPLSMEKRLDFSSAVKARLPELRVFAETLFQAVQADQAQPDEITVEFGVDFGGKTGVVVTEASASANVKFTLKWKKEVLPLPGEV